jgi:tripartite-type tricarboxylate transporter receptor subunit TctC
MKKIIVQCALLLGPLCGGAAQAAEPYPSRPVTIVVPFAPGGSSDAISRIMAQELGKKWKQSVIIENRAGGQTMIGTGYVVRAPADGYTIGYVSYAWSTNQFLAKELPYKPEDLAPITLLGRYPLALYTRGDLPVKTLADFVAYAKHAEKPLTFGDAGVGSSSHLAALDFADSVGIKVVSVPYKSGTIGAINDMMGGQIDALFEGRTFKQFADDKRLKVLVLAQPKQMANWTEVPDAVQAGYPQLDIAAYFGLMVAAKTPKDIQQQLSRDVGDVLRDPQVQQRLLQLGLVPTPQTPAQFGVFLQEQHDRLGALIERHRAQLSE